MHTLLKHPGVSAVLLAAAIAGGSIASAQQTAPVTPFESGVKISVTASKPAKGDGYYESKRQKIVLALKFLNSDAKQTYEGFTATVSVFGQSGQDHKARKVLSQENVTLSLPPLKTQEHVCKEVVTQFYQDGSYKSGFSYDGWIIVVKDAKGKIVHVKSSSATMAKYTELAAKLKLNECYNSKLQPVASPRY